MFSHRLWLFLFWILYFGLKIVRWTIRKWTSHDRRKKDGNVSETFERGRGNTLTDSACCNKNQVEADDTSVAMDVVYARINRLENQMLDLANNMTTLKAENVKSEKQIIGCLHALGEKVDKIEKYAMAMTKITNESSADHKCCGRSAETSSCCAENYKTVKNLMEAFEKATDESRKSVNEKIDQLMNEIVTIQMNNARNPSPPATPVPQTPAMSVTPARPKPSNNDETGIENTWTMLQYAGSDVISEQCSSDGWSDDKKGYIPPPPQRPLPPLPVTSNNDVAGISSRARPESSNNGETGECSSDGRSDDEIGSTSSPLQRPQPPISELSEDHDNGVQDIPIVVQEFRRELNPEESFSNNSIVMAWLNKFDSAAKVLWKLARNFAMSSSEERKVGELTEAADDSVRESEDDISMNDDNEYQRLRLVRRSNLSIFYQPFE